MKINDAQLDRLLKAAAGQAGIDTEIPSALRTRILANWRAGGSEQDPFEAVRWLRIGVGFACALLLVIAAFSRYDLNREQASEFKVPGAVINLALSR